jgi:hypothetical protein
VDLRARHLLHGDDASPIRVVDADHLAERVSRHDDVVAQQHRERLARNVVLGQGHRRAEPQRLGLADVVDTGQVRDGANLLQLVELAGLLEPVLELERAIEVVLDRPLAAARDDEDVLDPGPHRLFHHVLNGGLVHDREHLLGLGLGRGEEPGSEPGRGDDGLLHLHG